MKKKTVKAWAVVKRKNTSVREYGALKIQILAIFRKERQAMADCNGYERAVPCTITY